MPYFCGAPNDGIWKKEARFCSKVLKTAGNRDFSVSNHWSISCTRRRALKCMPALLSYGDGRNRWFRWILSEWWYVKSQNRCLAKPQKKCGTGLPPFCRFKVSTVRLLNAHNKVFDSGQRLMKLGPKRDLSDLTTQLTEKIGAFSFEKAILCCSQFENSPSEMLRPS